MNFKPEEIEQFIKDKELVFDRVEAPLGGYYALSYGGSNINHNDPYDAALLAECLWYVNGA